MESDSNRAVTPDSWIEISSRPSTSSLSSAGDDAIVPNSPQTNLDLRNRHHNHHRIQRRGRVVEPSPLRLSLPQRAPSTSGSSQDEYEESESESDRVMTSSNEGVNSSASDSAHSLLPGGYDQMEVDESDGDGDDNDDEDETTLGVGLLNDPNVFTPQPNSFNHTPLTPRTRYRSAVPGSYFPSTTTSERDRHSAHTQRHSYSGNQGTRTAHSPFPLPDHDAALRASLNTLLSCAAAARKKSDPLQTAANPQNNHSSRIDASTLRMVPESVALGLQRPTLQSRRMSSTPSSSQRAPSPAVESHGLFSVRNTQPEATTADHSKRKAAAGAAGAPATTARSASKERQRLAKKPKRAAAVGEESISPTLMTWVVSAGVLFLVSALSFSAGYKVGKESVGLDIPSGADAGSLTPGAGRTSLGLRRAAVRAAVKA